MFDKRKIYIYIIVALTFALGIVLGQCSGRRVTEGSIVRAMRQMQQTPSNKLDYTLALIENQYVDPLSADTLVEHLMPALVEQLDPHSVYIPAAELQRVNEPLDGEFDGIGVVFNMLTDTVIVLNVIPSGPSDKAGVRAGDRIMRVNDTLIAGQKLSTDAVMRRLRGKRGSEVRLSLARQDIADAVEVTVVRDKIPIKSIETAFMIDKNIGYVRMSQFARTTYAELVRAIGALRSEGMRALILDLRGNAGGFLDQAIAVANEFLPKGEMIVYTEDRNHKQLKEYSDGQGKSTDIALAVLIDEESASSSEILAGALQDNDRGTIIGRRSFGKGLVQSQIPFNDGSALRLTVARYYTPTGRSIQRPYKLGEGDNYMYDIIDRYNHNELFSADSIHFADSLKRLTPKGKTVYGGGGIMPDIFVPLDTTALTRYFVEVSGRNILYRYTIDYADRHRRELDKIRTQEDMQRHFAANPSLLNDFIAYAAAKGVAADKDDIAKSRALILAQLRAYIARNTVLEENGFYGNIYTIDPPVLRAIEELSAEIQNS